MADTLVLANNSFMPGNFSATNLYSEGAAVFDSGTNQIFLFGNSGTIAILSAATDAVVKEIKTNDTFTEAAYDPASSEIFVVDSSSEVLLVMNDTTDTFTAGIVLISYGAPGPIVYDPGRQLVFLGAQMNLLGISGASNSIVATFTTTFPAEGLVYDGATHQLVFVGTSGSSGEMAAVNDTTGSRVWYVWINQYPYALVFAPKQEEFFASSENDQNISVVNDTTGKVSQTISDSYGPYNLVFDPTSGLIYVSNNVGQNISLLSPVTDKLVGTLPKGILGALDWAECTIPSMGEAVFGTGGTVTILQSATQDLVARVTVGSYPYSGVYDPAKHELFVPNAYSDNVSVISTITNRIVGWISVGQLPLAAAYDPALGEIFVANEESGNVSVISDATDTVVASIPVGIDPSAMAFAPVGNDLFVSNEGGNNVTVINVTDDRTDGSLDVGFDPTGLAYSNQSREVFSVSPALPQFYAITVQPSGGSTLSGPFRLPNSAWGVCYDSVNGNFYMSILSKNELVYVSPSNPLLDVVISVGFEPEDLFCDDQNGDVYVTSLSGSDNVTVVSGASESVVGNVSVSGSPSGGLIDPDQGAVVVTVGPTGSLSYINAGLAVSSFSASPNPLTLGQTTTFSTQTLNGAAPLTYAYTGLPSPCVSSNTSSLACNPTEEGSFNVTVTVTDASHAMAQATIVLEITPLTLTSYTATPNPVAPGSTTTLTASVAGGLPPYTFVYSGLPGGCATANTSSLSCTPDVEGSFQVQVNVTDSSGARISDNLTLTVNPLRVTSFFPNPNPLWLGNATWLNVTLSGGLAPFTYRYTGLPRGCPSANVGNLSCTPTGEGLFDVVVNVTDSLGYSSSDSAELNIYQDFAKLTLTPSPSASLMPNGEQTFFAMALNATGATLGSLTSSSWAISPLSLGTLSNMSGTSTKLTAGSTLGQGLMWFNATYGPYSRSVVDKIFVSTTAGPSILSFAANPSTITLGTSTLISVDATGTGTLTFAYTGLPPGCTSADVNSLSCTPTTVGNYSIGVAVTDPLGREVDGTADLEVKPVQQTDILAKLVVSPLGPLQLGLGASEGFTAAPENSTGGGVTGVTIDWSLAPAFLGSLNVTIGPVVTLTTGQHTVVGNLYINATQNGITKSIVVAISVAPAGSGPSGPTYFGLDEFDFVSLIVAILAIAIPVLVSVWLEFRKKENRKEAKKEAEKKEEEAKAAGSAAPSGSGLQPSPSPASAAPPSGEVLPPPPPSPSTAAEPMPDADLSFVMGGPVVPASTDAPSPAVVPTVGAAAVDSGSPASPETSTSPKRKSCIMCGTDMPVRAKLCPSCKEPQD